jgi:hypothetical protein
MKEAPDRGTEPGLPVPFGGGGTYEKELLIMDIWHVRYILFLLWDGFTLNNPTST